MRDLLELPKAHLHTHLESTVRPATVRDLGGTPWTQTSAFTSFRAFADQRSVVRDLLREPCHFRRVAEEFCQDEAAQGVKYAEVTFTAAAHGGRLGDLHMPLEAVVDGLAAGYRTHGIRTRLILDHSRRRPVERLWQTVELALQHPEVVAVGLAGDEACPAAPFAEPLAAARASGLRLVHHAGETAGPASVWEALTVGHAERIGHGIRVLDDPEIVDELARRRIPLEVCPSSNVLLGLAPSLRDHPLPRLVEAGLLVTINTDGEGPLNAEYEHLRHVFGYRDADIAHLAKATLDASFAPAEVQTELTAGIDEWLST